ncbi:hypothetical protein FDP41_003761 [Naegleria fowleri]|uniref:Uncharacterized protein n=1 Tax=Naegleria fowleri TaxID=5763 RepID=A0A6A5BSW3_NAEFO|nr:uncharacterized protein FDP41_003761 [Naegleria fowleri]KAF0977108.1 hypothetical protein FDP41_003761 [Naegleria fowleri]
MNGLDLLTAAATLEQASPSVRGGGGVVLSSDEQQQHASSSSAIIPTSRSTITSQQPSSSSSLVVVVNDGTIEIECYQIPSAHVLQDKYNQKPGRKTMKEIQKEQNKDVFQMKTRVSKLLKNGLFLLKNLRLYLHVESGFLYPGISTRDGDLFFPVDKSQLLQAIKIVAPDIEDENLPQYHVNVNGKGFKLNGVKYSKQDVVSLIVLLKNSSTNYEESFKNRERKLILLSPPTYYPRLCGENDPRAIKLKQKIQQQEKNNATTSSLGDERVTSTSKRKHGKGTSSSTESSSGDGSGSDSEMSHELMISEIPHPHSPPAIVLSQDAVSGTTTQEPPKKKKKQSNTSPMSKTKRLEIMNTVSENDEETHTANSSVQSPLMLVEDKLNEIQSLISETSTQTYCNNNHLTLEELVEKTPLSSSTISLESLIESCNSLDKDFLALMGELMERELLPWMYGWQHYLRRSYDYALEKDPTIIYKFLDMHRELFGNNPNYKIKDKI